MARKKIDVAGAATVHVVRYTVQRRWLLKPGRKVDRKIEEIVARAQRRCGVAVHAIAVLPDRIEMVVTVGGRSVIADFLAEVFGGIAIAVAEQRGWRGPVWEERKRASVESVEEAEMIDLAIEVSVAGVREGLVDTAEQWPGITSARRCEAIEIVAVPALRAMPAQARDTLIEQRLAEIAAHAVVRRRGQPAPGRRWILEREPTLPDPRSPQHALVAAFDLVYPAA